MKLFMEMLQCTLVCSVKIVIFFQLCNNDIMLEYPLYQQRHDLSPEDAQAYVDRILCVCLIF